jgi:hypothetical protein
MKSQIGDLVHHKLDLLVKVDLLVPNNIQLSNLVVNDSLSLEEGGVDFPNLVHDIRDLFLSLSNEPVIVLDLLIQVVGEFKLLGLFEIVLHKTLPFLEECSLIVTNGFE